MTSKMSYQHRLRFKEWIILAYDYAEVLFLNLKIYREISQLISFIAVFYPNHDIPNLYFTLSTRVTE